MITTNTTGDGFKPQNNIVWPFPNSPSHWVVPYVWPPYPYVLPIVTTSPPFDYPSHTELLEMLQDLRRFIDDDFVNIRENLDKLIERMGGNE